MPFLTGEEVARHAEAQHKGAAPIQSSNTEVEALKASVAALTAAVTAMAQAQTSKKPGRPRKAAEV